MNLEKLKKKATVSELSLIDAVERLVRSEYDIDMLRKQQHDMLQDAIYIRIMQVLKDYGVPKCFRPHEESVVKSFMYDLGSAMRLEVERPCENWTNA